MHIEWLSRRICYKIEKVSAAKVSVVGKALMLKCVNNDSNKGMSLAEKSQ